MILNYSAWHPLANGLLRLYGQINNVRFSGGRKRTGFSIQDARDRPTAGRQAVSVSQPYR